MLFILLYFVNSSSNEENGFLYVLFARPNRNPLEMYPPTKIPLCIHDSMPGYDLVICSKCRRKILQISRDNIESFQSWCSTKISNDNYTILTEQLKENYSLCFSSGKKSIHTPIGKYNRIYTQYSFFFSEKDGKFTLSNIFTSKLVNFTVGEIISFTYQIVFTDSQSLTPNWNSSLSSKSGLKSESNRSLLYFFFFCIVFLTIATFFVIRPDFLSKEIVNAVATIPSNNFLIVTLTGAGAGVYGYIITLLISCLIHYPFETSTINLVVPAISSAIFTGTAISIICKLCHLNDAASALYFSPLIFLCIILYIIFSIQWIPVCFGTCITIPMNIVFIYIVTVVIVKLPVNFIMSLIAGSLITAPPYYTIRSIKTRKFTSSRSFFLSISNIFLFIIIFPLFDELMDTPNHVPFDIGLGNIKLILMYIPIWIVSSAIVGISSLTMADSFNWGILAFISASGAGVVLWVVSFFKATLTYGMTGSLQISLHMAILSLLCIGLSISAGSVSTMSAAIWIVTTGVPSNHDHM